MGIHNYTKFLRKHKSWEERNNNDVHFNCVLPWRLFLTRSQKEAVLLRAKISQSSPATSQGEESAVCMTREGNWLMRKRYICLYSRRQGTGLWVCCLSTFFPPKQKEGEGREQKGWEIQKNNSSSAHKARSSILLSLDLVDRWDLYSLEVFVHQEWKHLGNSHLDFRQRPHLIHQ